MTEGTNFQQRDPHFEYSHQGVRRREITQVERLARYLCRQRRVVDSLINEQCDPYPTWEQASDNYRQGCIDHARGILDGSSND